MSHSCNRIKYDILKCSPQCSSVLVVLPGILTPETFYTILENILLSLNSNIYIEINILSPKLSRKKVTTLSSLSQHLGI